MATATYAYTPGQAVFVVMPASFGIGKATIVSVQITANPLVTKYVVQYLVATRAPTLVDEASIFADLVSAQAAYGPLVV
jgi:hypothetical protein